MLVIGLDGATFDVMKPLVAAGRLPCIADLMQRGVTASLRSTLPPLTMPAWSSFITGVNPGQHGLVDFIRRQPDSYDYAPVSAADRQAESLWSMVSRQGKRVSRRKTPTALKSLRKKDTSCRSGQQSLTFTEPVAGIRIPRSGLPATIPGGAHGEGPTLAWPRAASATTTPRRRCPAGLRSATALSPSGPPPAWRSSSPELDRT